MITRALLEPCAQMSLQGPNTEHTQTMGATTDNEAATTTEPMS